MIERAICVTVKFDDRPQKSTSQDISGELASLVESGGLKTTSSVLFKDKTPNAAHLIGSGKAQSLAQRCRREKANVVIFSHDLSPTQQRNLDEIIGFKTIDRTQLILDIFAQRARSSEGKLQVELAQLKYLLPRLGGQGVYLSRLGGGIGTRGPGEQKLEMDRRRLRERIVKLSRELADLQKKRLAAVIQKKEKRIPVVAIVGYTNAGKSSLFNQLTRGQVVVKDQLFSTLDTTTRLVALPGKRSALLVDTVGFIRDLPHHLIESFKATLEEAVHAELLLHVIDASCEDVDARLQAVESVLRSLGASQERAFLVYNKIDRMKGASFNMPERKNYEATLAVSAVTQEGLEALKLRMADALMGHCLEKAFFIPSTRQDIISFIYKQTNVVERRDTPTGSHFSLYLTEDANRSILSKLESPYSSKSSLK